MKALVILNSHAHSGTEPQQRDHLLDEISVQLKSALHLESIECRKTEFPGHASELAEMGSRSGFDYIFAAGGDGTVHEVLNGIMGLKLEPEKRPALGVLPFGTSNDFFSALKSTEAAHKLRSVNDLALLLDVGYVRFDNVERYLCLTAGVGLMSRMNEQYLEASKQFGRRFAHLPALIRTIVDYQFLPNVKLSIDGSPSRARRILAVTINNSPVIAGGIALTPDAVLDDGYFDLCIIKPVSLLRLIALAFQVVTQKHVYAPHAMAIQRIHKISITAKKPLPINIDGELVPELSSKARHTVIEIMPRALKMVIPSLCEIQSEQK